MKKTPAEYKNTTPHRSLLDYNKRWIYTIRMTIYIYSKMYLTLSVTMKPTNNGPNMEVIFAKLLVMPNNVPAKFGARSMWLVKNPVNTPLFKLRAMVNKTNAPVTDVSNKYREINAKAPPQWAKLFHIFRWFDLDIKLCMLT